MVGCGAGTEELAKVQELKHVEVLDRDATDVWTACKHAVVLLLELAPDYFAKAEFEKGSGGPGSIGVFHFGYAVPRRGSVKHRIDRIDDDAQIFAYSVIKTDNATSSSFIAKMQFTSAPGGLQQDNGNVDIAPVTTRSQADQMRPALMRSKGAPI